MATIERSHSGWYLDLHSTDGKTHSVYSDLSEEEREALDTLVSDFFGTFVRAWLTRMASLDRESAFSLVEKKK